MFGSIAFKLVSSRSVVLWVSACVRERVACPCSTWVRSSLSLVLSRSFVRSFIQWAQSQASIEHPRTSLVTPLAGFTPIIPVRSSRVLVALDPPIDPRPLARLCRSFPPVSLFILFYPLLLILFILRSSLSIISIIMSWQSYVDDQLIATGMISKAVICGHDGNIWAQSAGFNVSGSVDWSSGRMSQVWWRMEGKNGPASWVKSPWGGNKCR